MTAFRRRPFFYAAIALISVCAFFRHSPGPHDVSREAGEEPLLLGGFVVSEVETREAPYGGELTGFVLSVKKIWTDEGVSKDVTGRVRCYLKDAGAKPAYGDEVVIRGELALPSGLRNPGGFDQKNYLALQRIHSVFYGAKNSKIRILSRGKGNWVYASALEAKRALSGAISRHFEGDEAAFLKALFLGERREINEDFKELFIKTGTMHILAVSGFNVGFLCAAVFLLLKLFPISKNWKHAAAIAAIWAYCLIVGWQAPVFRASVMASVFLLGGLIGRRSDALNSLGLAACLILLINPAQVHDIGFQLSFLAVFAIICAVPVFLKRPVFLPFETPGPEEKARFYLRELFWVSFVCLFATLPVTVQSFYIVTPLSILSNLAVVPLSFVLFLTGVLFFLAAPWSVLAAGPAAAMSGVMKLFIGSLIGIEGLPGACVTVGKLSWPLWVLLTAGLIRGFSDKRIKTPFLRAATLVLFTAAVFFAQEIVRGWDRSFRMTVLDVGQGDAIYFEFPGGGNLLVDAGKSGPGDKGRTVVTPFLKSKGVRTIALAAASHPQEDHIGGFLSVFEEFKVLQLADAGSEYPTELFRRFQKAALEEKSRRRVLRAGDKIEEFEGVDIEVLGPAPALMNRGEVNNESLVFRIVYGDTSFLLTGDIQSEAMEALLTSREKPASTVLKVPHHGAKLKETGRRFVFSVNPRFSVISSGERNPFHHPDPATLEILSSIPGNTVFRTDRQGAIQIVSDGKRVSAETLVHS